MKYIYLAFESDRAKESFDKDSNSLTAACRMGGFALQQLGTLQENQTTTAHWDDLIQSPQATLLLVGSNPAWVKLAAMSVRRSKKPAVAFTPIFVSLHPFDMKEFAPLIEAGVSDLLLPQELPEVLVSRINLRLKEASERARVDHERQAHAMRDAKSETILKQREEFLSVCAHDLRSPMGIVQSCLNMILNAKEIETQLQPLHLELLGRAKRQTSQALTLVSDLLDVMSYEQGLKPQYQLLKLDDFLKEFHRDYSVKVSEKQIQFHYVNAVADWRVLFDADRIRQLLQNLVTNAVKFTDSGRQIHLNVMPFHGRRKSDPKFPMVVVSLRDEGKGIPQTELQKIFDRFTQVKDYSRADGRGLGLTVAKQISNLHDGNLWVESQEGQGSTFFVLFPHVVSRMSADDRTLEATKTLIIVEPHEHRRELHRSACEKAGFQVHFAKDGVEALEQTFYQLPAATILTTGTAKMSEEEVVNILKGDALTKDIPLYYANEVGRAHTKPEVAKLFNGSLKLPLNAKEITQFLSIATARRRAA